MEKYREVETLLLDLVARDIQLYIDGEKLKFKAPKGIITGEDRVKIKSSKEQIIEYLSKSLEDGNAYKGENFPLTDIQAAYLMGRHEAFDLGGLPCHIYFELEYDLLDPEVLEQAIYKTIERHPMMRAAFSITDGTQRILPLPEKYDLEVLEAKNDLELQGLLRHRWDEMSHPLYNPEEGFLFHFKLTQGVEKSYLHFSIEFLIADWASIWNIISDMEAFYYEPNLELKPLGVTFQEAVYYQKTRKKTLKYIQDKAYWQDHIEKLSSPPELPILIDSQKAVEGKIFFKRYQLKLDSTKWDRVKKYVAQRGVTPTSVIMSAYASVIARWSKNKKFSLNLTVLNRPDFHEDIEDIVGDFTSNILIYVDREKKISFEEGVKQISESIFEAVEHKAYSAVSLMRDMQKYKGEDILMPFVFTSALGLVSNEKKPIRTSMTRHAISQTPQVYIDCQALEDNTGLSINWDVRQGVFPEGLIEDMFASFQHLIENLAEDINVWDSKEYVCLPDWQIKERRKINQTEEKLNVRLLHQGIIEYGLSNAYNPNKLAVVCDNIELSYQDMFAKAGKLTKEIIQLGLRKEDKVCVFMEKSVDQIVGVLSILSAGGVYVPLDPHSGRERIADIIHQVKPIVILTDGKNEQELVESGIKVIDVSKISFTQEDSLLNLEFVSRDLDDMAYIIFTSGTTGVPKGVAISHRQAANTNESINTMWNLKEDSVAFGISQLNFDLSVYDVFGILSLGGTLVMPSQENYKNPANWIDLMCRYGVNIWNSVPALMQMLITYIQYGEVNNKIPPLHLVMLSGDWTPQSLPLDIKKYWSAVNICVMGGATEGAIWSIYHIWEKNLPGWVSIPYGRPLANQRYLVLDGNMEDCPYWVIGQLAIAGDGVAIGYYGDKQLTQEKFPLHQGEKVYLTGDLGRYRPGGEIEFIGRMDRQLKIRGHRIEPGEVEVAIKKELGIDQVVVSVLQSEPILGALIVTNEEVDFVKLKERLRKDLPEYMIPSCYCLTKTMPLTKNGKLDVKRILNMLDESKGAIQEKHDMNHMTDMEKKILSMWSEELSCSELAIEDDLYDYGADSLLIAKMSGRMKKEIDERISFEEYLVYTLNHPTVRDIASFIEEK